MMKNKHKYNWPSLRAVSNHGKLVYMVDARIQGHGERKFFDNPEEAQGWRQQQRIKRQNEGNSAFVDHELAAFGWSIKDAVKFALTHLRQRAISKPLKEAVAELLWFKQDRVGKVRLYDIQNRLARFVKACGEKTMAQITPDEINAFLAKIPHPTTRNDYRKEIVMLWHFCRARKWVSEALDKTHVLRETEPEKGRVILSVEQTARLMEASIDPDICALNAMVLFGGLRREEVEKLDWSAVNFRTGYIEVSVEVSKVSRERFAPIPDNLREWLMPLAKKRGPIVVRILMRPLRMTWKSAGLYPWTQDAHRHSFISYRRRLIGDAQTALDAGTSETIIKRHYKRPVTKEDAECYFNIRPAGAAAGKVISIASV